MKVMTLLLVFVMILPAAAWADAPRPSGTNTIPCEASTPLGRINCDPNGRRSSLEMVAHDQEAVGITVSWDANSRDSTVLEVELISSDPSCFNDDRQDASCFHKRVQGRSPLMLTLEGSTVKAATLTALVHLPDTCVNRGPLGGSHCESVPVKVVIDQQYAYAWSFS